jgi:hypothetical protein
VGQNLELMEASKMAKKHDTLTKDAEAFVRHALSHRTDKKVSDAAVRAAAVKISRQLSSTLTLFTSSDAHPSTDRD